jgi:hypothetical protein
MTPLWQTGPMRSSSRTCGGDLAVGRARFARVLRMAALLRRVGESASPATATGVVSPIERVPVRSCLRRAGLRQTYANEAFASANPIGS